MWTPDGSLVDLTSLLSPGSGWTLARALSITDTNWITGIGLYDPDGPGGAGPYLRLFLLKIGEARS